MQDGQPEISLGRRRRIARRLMLRAGGGGAIAAILAACGGTPPSPTAAPKAAEPTKPAAAPTTAPTAAAKPAEPTKPAAAAPTAAAKPAEPTKPAAAATTAPAAATKPAAAGKALKTGLVTDVGKVDDKSFNQSAWEGVQLAQKEGTATDIKFIETTDPKDYAKNIGTFADGGYEVIVTVGFALGEATIAAAKKYQNVKFIGIDQFQAEPVTNVAGLIFDEDKAGYLAGALAALMSKSGSIGAVLGTDAVPPVWRFGEGYRVGAQAARPDVKVSLVYHNDVGFDKTFVDPEWGKTTAQSMIAKGADVIFGAGGKTGNGALIGSAEKNTMAIGVDTDQFFTVPEAQKVLLSSAMKLIIPGTAMLIKSASGGALKGGNTVGEVGLAPFHEFESKVPADVKTKLAAIDKGLKDGSIKTGVAPAKPK